MRKKRISKLKIKRKAILKSVAVILSVSLFIIPCSAIAPNIIYGDNYTSSSYVHMQYDNHTYSIDDYDTFVEKLYNNTWGVASTVANWIANYFGIPGGLVDIVQSLEFNWSKADPLGSVSLTGYNNKQISGVFYPDGANYQSKVKYSLTVDKSGIYSFKNYTISTSIYYTENFLTNGIKLYDTNNVLITENNCIGSVTNDLAITEFEYHLEANTQYIIEFDAYYLYFTYQTMSQVHADLVTGNHLIPYTVNYQSNIRVTPVSFDDETAISEPAIYQNLPENPTDDNSAWVLDHIDANGDIYYKANKIYYNATTRNNGSLMESRFDDTNSITYTNSSTICTKTVDNRYKIVSNISSSSVSDYKVQYKLYDFHSNINGVARIKSIYNVEITQADNQSIKIYDTSYTGNQNIENSEKVIKYYNGIIGYSQFNVSAGSNYTLNINYYNVIAGPSSYTYTHNLIMYYDVYLIITPFEPISQQQVNNYSNNYTYNTDNNYNTQNIYNTINNTVTYDIDNNTTMEYTNIYYDYSTSSVYFYNSETNEYSTVTYTDNSTTTYYKNDENIVINNYYYNNYDYGDYSVNDNSITYNNNGGSSGGDSGNTGGDSGNNSGGVVPGGTNAWDFLTAIITPIIEFLTELLEGIVDAGKALFNAISDLFGNVFSSISQIGTIFQNRYIYYFIGIPETTATETTVP